MPSTQPDAAPPSADAAVVEAGPPLDASAGAPDAPPAEASMPPDPDAGCAPVLTSPVATITQWKGSTPPDIDGDLSEWACAPRYHLATGTVAYATNPGSPLAADVSLAWDSKNLYVAATIYDTTVGAGTYDDTDPYYNASFEVYVSGDAALSGDYDAQTHHYVTDYQELIVDYGPLQTSGTPDTSPAHFNAAAQTTTGGWTYESSVAWQAVLPKGQNAFASGMNLGFDLEVNSGDGTSQTAIRLMSLAAPHPACACTMACCCNQTGDLPYCDSSEFGRVALQ